MLPSTFFRALATYLRLRVSKIETITKNAMMPQLTAMDSGMSMPPKMGRVNAVSTLSSSFKAAVSSFIIPPPLASGAACAPGWLYVLNLSDKKRTKEKNRKGGNGDVPFPHPPCCVLYAAIIPPFPAICKPLAAHSAFWIFRDSDRLKILCTMHNKAH